ncbi:transketolase [Paludibaculum fermentans]|uniref:Transketolase n=1 Tax=Paludibaculum fermentans TaxID=1473598 RepID=A0A7S7SIU8_PALFE|nr:transketolase [Paludibaculum fermentans]QOY87397.1 transketolase [Paludibaculum fermentans]
MSTEKVAAESTSEQIHLLIRKAAALRIDSVRATTAAGSGHPTSCASAAEIVSTLFFAVMRFDPKNPQAEQNDVFILSKGHAAPLLYAAWAEAGAFPRERLWTLRKFGSELEGHPTPRLPFVPVATGSLGQGLPAAAGIAYNAKHLEQTGQRIYVLLGDGEAAEGSVWEAAAWSAFHQLDNLCVTVDVNCLGQSQPTMLRHNMDAHAARWSAFGWHVAVVDGHSPSQLLGAYRAALKTRGRPTVVLARTIKGKGLPGIEGDEHWHGRALDSARAEKVIHELTRQMGDSLAEWEPSIRIEAQATVPPPVRTLRPDVYTPPYDPRLDSVSTRQGFGSALAAIGARNKAIVVVDGDVKNSTYTEEFEKLAQLRFLQGYIAEQNMVGIAMGLAARRKVPFVATFACFLTRAFDFIRMAAISGLNIKIVGTHAGVSIGEDGPSQMGLEDLAMMCAEPGFTVLYPSDATSAWRATALIAAHDGPCYLRLGRPAVPVLYGEQEPFAIGRCKVLRKSDQDRALIVAAGITVFEALAAYEQLQAEGLIVRVIDLFSIHPIDGEELVASARDSGGIVVTVEDHYRHGGLGDAVLSALARHEMRVCKLAVSEIPRSGTSRELLAEAGISAGDIRDAVRSALNEFHSHDAQ